MADRRHNPTGADVSEQPADVKAKSAAKRLFDLRWLIAAMFLVYGVVLMVTGILDNQAEVDKAAGVRINLWTGIGMFVVGLVFVAWARWKPLRHDDPGDRGRQDAGDGVNQPRDR